MSDASSADTSRARLFGGAILGAITVALVTVAVATRSWSTGFLALCTVVALVVGVRWRPMHLEFEVGDLERHHVEFSFNKFWGNLAIRVDGAPVIRDLRTFSFSLTKTYRFTVGVEEAHEVRIEKDRALLLAGARRQPVRGYVDDVLVAEGAA